MDVIKLAIAKLKKEITNKFLKRMDYSEEKNPFIIIELDSKTQP